MMASLIFVTSVLPFNKKKHKKTKSIVVKSIELAKAKDVFDITSIAADGGRSIAGHGDNSTVDKVSVVIQPPSDEMIEENIAPELVVDDERIGRVLRP